MLEYYNDKIMESLNLNPSKYKTISKYIEMLSFLVFIIFYSYLGLRQFLFENLIYIVMYLFLHSILDKMQIRKLKKHISS